MARLNDLNYCIECLPRAGIIVDEIVVLGE